MNIFRVMYAVNWNIQQTSLGAYVTRASGYRVSMGKHRFLVSSIVRE